MSTLLTVMASNAVVATGLALLVLIAQRWIRQPAVRHTLWVIVLLKLVTPPLWHPELKWLPAVVPQSEVTAISETTAAGVGADRSQREVASPLPSEVAALPAPAIAELPPEQGRLAERHTVAIPAATAANTALPEPAPRPLASMTARWSWPKFTSVVATVWFGGALVWLTLAVVRILRFQRCLRFAEVADESIQRQAAFLGEQLGLRKTPRVWLVPGRVSPMLWAAGHRARLIVPAELFAELDEASRDALLLHELAHYRRGDHWVRYLELTTTILYWWHPLVWLVRRELRITEELACDAWVVSQRPESRRIYAEMLVKTLGFLSGESTPVLASGIGTADRIESRLIRIMRDASAVSISRWIKLALLLIGLTVLSQTPALVRAQPEPKPVADSPAAAPQYQVDDQSVNVAVRRIEPSVVNIKTVKNVEGRLIGVGKNGGFVMAREVIGLASGIVVDPRGYIVTAHHVIADADSVRVTLPQVGELNARVLVLDKKHDLALIKVELIQPAAVMPLGVSSDLKVGQKVAGIGLRGAHGPHVTWGILSALSRDVTVNDSLAYHNLLQSDGNIPLGTSGGPLINLDGEVVGINVATRSEAQRIGFAIPIDEARRGIAGMIRKLHSTQHGLLSHDLKRGGQRPQLVIDGTEIGSTASKSGFQTGDVIVQAGDIAVQDQVDFERALIGKEAGDSIPIVVRRNDQQITLPLQLVPRGFDKASEALSTLHHSGSRSGAVDVAILPQAFLPDPRAKPAPPRRVTVSRRFTMKFLLVTGDPLEETPDNKREVISTPDLSFDSGSEVTLKFGPAAGKPSRRLIGPDEEILLKAEWQKDLTILLQFDIPEDPEDTFVAPGQKRAKPKRAFGRGDVVSRPVKPFESFKVRLRTNSPQEQTWLEGKVISSELVVKEVPKK